MLKLIWMMAKTRNRRGMELAIGTVITLVILLIVLVVIASFFLGSTKTLFTPMTNLSSQAAGELEKQAGVLG